MGHDPSRHKLSCSCFAGTPFERSSVDFPQRCLVMHGFSRYRHARVPQLFTFTSAPAPHPYEGGANGSLRVARRQPPVARPRYRARRMDTRRLRGRERSHTHGHLPQLRRNPRPPSRLPCPDREHSTTRSRARPLVGRHDDRALCQAGRWRPQETAEHQALLRFSDTRKPGGVGELARDAGCFGGCAAGQPAVAGRVPLCG
jgi:hypothetical protein